MALRLKSSGNEIEIFFHHKILDVDEVWIATGFQVGEPRRCSTAVIKINGICQGEGTVVCHPNDNFNKATGRHKALTEVLTYFNRELREAVWKKYESEIGFA